MHWLLLCSGGIAILGLIIIKHNQKEITGQDDEADRKAKQWIEDGYRILFVAFSFVFVWGCLILMEMQGLR